jgi:hypothetical protein
MSWKELARQIDRASRRDVDVDLSHLTAPLQLELSSARWGGTTGPLEVAVTKGWTLIVPVDGGGGDMTGDLDGLDVEVDLETAFHAAFDGKREVRVDWGDLNVELPDADSLGLTVDTGQDPSVDETIPLQLRGPKQRIFTHGKPDNLTSGVARIELLEWEWNSSAECFTFKVAIELPGVARAPKGTHQLVKDFTCYECCEFELEPPDLGPLEDLIDEAIDHLEQMIEASRG